jgi:hypothetical protein
MAGATPVHGDDAIPRTLLVFGAVLGATAATLAVLNHVPDLAGTNPRRIRTAASLRAVEARLGQGLLLPSYFPQWLVWPPSSIRFTDGPPTIVAFVLDARDGSGPVLTIVQTFEPDAAIPSRLLPPGTVIESEPARIGLEPARLSHLRLADGSSWRELAWTEQDRRVTFRFRTQTSDVLRMARSLRKERP